MTNRDIFDRYLQALGKTPLDEKTEHADRSALEALLEALANKHAKGVTVHHEPRRVADKGAPDFQVRKGGLILGYVENKGIGENLDKVLKSDQIKRYKELSGNIVLTDYLHFIWIGKNGIQRETLCHATDLETPRFHLREERVAEVDKLLQGFFSTAPQGIDKSPVLALALANRSKLLRDFLGKELLRQQREHTEGRLYGLYEVFKKQVFHELTLSDFADAFAQMLAYGLFLARLNSGKHAVTLDNAREYVPGSFRLIRELVDFLSELNKHEYANVRWVVEEVLSIVNGLDLTAIHEDLSFRQRKAISRKVRAADEEEHRLFERDPFIYFYEDYLKAYDPDMRKARGVYYTPPPVVNFIVRAIDSILKERFGIREGLADHRRVTVLDFACGTGTFLLEVFQCIFDNVGGNESARADLIVREHILKNLFGFGYLIAPYTIAHLKLSQYLKDQKHPLKKEERLQVFLTNTLEPIEPQRNLLLPAITAEVEAAQAVKERPILVITGNPPYSGHSKNKGAWITAKVDDYKYVDGVFFGEKKHWLLDDYVKFIRFAQTKMDEVPQGIVGVITSHAWIYNPTFRGMRQSLSKTFQQIYIVDLHGSSKPREASPNGVANDNVFDIMKGVAITLLVKGPGLEPGVWFGDVWGHRLEKYQVCAAADYQELTCERVEPTSPFYFFSPHSSGADSGWLDYPRLDEIFPSQTTGMLTGRDSLNVAFESNELTRRLRKFEQLEIEEAREEFQLGADVTDWNVEAAQKDLRKSRIDTNLLRRIAYRPFDERVVLYTGQSKGLMARPSRSLAEAIDTSSLALGAVRRVEEGEFRHACVYALLPDGHSVSSKETTHVFPLFVPRKRTKLATGKSRVENISPKFRELFDRQYGHSYAAEEIFAYIYAVLYAGTYRKRYAEFLRNDFPRIPLPETKPAFDALSGLGWALIQAHLLRQFPRKKLATYHGSGDHTVEAVRYVPADEAIAINKDQSFKPVPLPVWEFHIGGYQVLDKYLKSRKGRKLSLDEINHVSAIADSLAFTIDQMARIDAAYRAAFPDQG